MEDTPQRWERGDLVVSTDRRRLDLDAALGLLRQTFWGRDMPRDVLERAAENSLCFGLYRGATLIGFGRVVTDLATFAYLSDVVIAESDRNRGLGQWLVECMLAHPELQGLRRVTLLTRDSQALYVRCGFEVGAGDQTYMERRMERRGS